MINILLLKDKEGASADLFFQIMERYAKENNANCEIRHIKHVSLSEIKIADIIFCIRGDTPYMLYLLEISKKMGKTIVYYLDDSLKDLPNNSFRYPKRKKWHISCVKKCDVLLTTNSLISEDYCKFVASKRTAIINTPVEEILPYNLHDSVIKIVYAASEWHIDNYKKMIEPIMHELLASNTRRIEFYFVGFQPSGIDDEKVHIVPKMNLKDYQSYMKEAQFDIGIAALENSYFSERKYFNKFIEYTRYGICGIYSNTYPYRFVVKDKVNGILVSDNPRDWLEAINKLIDDKSLRIKCINNAQKYLENEHSDTVIFDRLKCDIPELLHKNVNDAQDDSLENIRNGINKFFRHYPFIMMEKMYMFRYSIEREGLKKALYRITRKF